MERESVVLTVKRGEVLMVEGMVWVKQGGRSGG
jgi:hypothetical protein